MEYCAAWLNYRQLSREKKTPIFILHQGIKTAKHLRAIEELTLGLTGLYGRQIIVTDNEEVYRLSVAGVRLQLVKNHHLGDEGFQLACKDGKCTIRATVENGLLYGSFELLRYIQVNALTDFDTITYDIEKIPSNPLRMLNHWDNMDGSIERGYSGNSFFFSEEEILLNERTHHYARMIASVGINRVTINNVNVKGTATELISGRYYQQLQKMAHLFATYGIKLFLSINFAAPMELGGLDLADPCDNQVITWWMEKSREVWENIPELGGFLVKADSEGRPGPFTYGRTQADGANMLAKAVEPFGGLIIWRCFVYNCQQDWRDLKTDRAKAGYDYFMPMDGQFADNVVLQIKNGPMDFQVREPISPLFGGLKKTNMMLEVQIAQEYTGQQRHLCYLVPWFKEILRFNTHCKEQDSTIEDIVSGRTYLNGHGGMAAVANTGNEYNWTGHDMAAANLYGFGRLAFDTQLSAEAEQFLKQWQALEPHVAKDVYKRTLERFVHQKQHAREWCDVINSYFYRKTGIADNQGRPLF